MSDTGTTTNPYNLPIADILDGAPGEPIDRDDAREIIFARLQAAIPADGGIGWLNSGPAQVIMGTTQAVLGAGAGKGAGGGRLVQLATGSAGASSGGTGEEQIRDMVAWEMADKIANGLSEQQLGRTLVSSIDLRPYMAKVIETDDTISGVKRKKNNRFAFDDPDMYAFQRETWGDGKLADYAEQAIVGLSQIEVDQAVEANGGQPLTTEQIAEISNFKTDVVEPNQAAQVGIKTAANEAMQQTGQQVTDSQVEQLVTGEATIDDLLTGLQDTGPQWDRDQIQQWLSSGQWNLEQLGAAEIEQGQTFGIDTGALRPGGPRRGPVNRGATMNVTEALNYIHGLDDRAMNQLQTQMEKAGYYGDASGAWSPGDQWDDASAQAWQQVLADSARQGIPVPQLLVTKGKQREDDTLRRRTSMWGDRSNITSLREMANAYALDQIGRQLRPEEFMAVLNTVQSLKDDRIGDMRAPDQTPWLNQQTAAMGFDETDVTRATGRIVDVEAGRMRAHDAMQKVNDYFGVEVPKLEEVDTSVEAG